MYVSKKLYVRNNSVKVMVNVIISTYISDTSHLSIEQKVWCKTLYTQSTSNTNISSTNIGPSTMIPCVNFFLQISCTHLLNWVSNIYFHNGEVRCVVMQVDVEEHTAKLTTCKILVNLCPAGYKITNNSKSYFV